MPIKDVCSKDVLTVARRDSIQDLAKLMQKRRVGSVVVVDKIPKGNTPVGIVTDRDIAMLVAEYGNRAANLSAEEVMNRNLNSVNTKDGLFEVLRFMQRNAVNRAPVVDDSGCLVGLVSTDDALDLISNELVQISRLRRRQRSQGKSIVYLSKKPVAPSKDDKIKTKGAKAA